MDRRGFQSFKRDLTKRKSEGTFHDENRGGLFASYDAPIWAGRCLEVGQLSKNV
jgi:hypothetical protein